MASTVTPLPTGAGPARTHSRRSVLRGLGIGGATAVVAGTALLSYRVYDSAVLDPGSGPAHDPWRRWQDTPGPLGAIAAAVLAASPHNTQPWAFAVGTDAIDVFTDPTRTTGSVDPYSRERYIGLGCALENLVLACGPRACGPRSPCCLTGPTASAWRTSGCPPLPRPRIPCTR